MPYAPATRCAEPMCPQMAAYRGRCSQHASQRERYRGTRQERGYTQQWVDYREVFLSTHSLCVDCLANGRSESATQVHHIHKLRDGGPKCEDSNCMALCARCHSRRTRRGE